MEVGAKGPTSPPVLWAGPSAGHDTVAVCSQDHSNQGRLEPREQQGEREWAFASELVLSRNTPGLAVLGHCLGMTGLCHHSKDSFQSEEHRYSPAHCTRVSLLLLQGRRAKSPQDEFYILGAVSSLQGSTRGLPVQLGAPWPMLTPEVVAAFLPRAKVKVDVRFPPALCLTWEEALGKHLATCEALGPAPLCSPRTLSQPSVYTAPQQGLGAFYSFSLLSTARNGIGRRS